MPVTIKISGLEEIRNKIASIDMNKLCYNIASSLKGEIKHRVHVEGKASDGSNIGEYSEGYMKVRTDNFKSKKIVRGERKGQHRKIYNRNGNKMVVLSLTRQMEMDMSSTNPIPIENGFGIGYNNDLNYKKAKWQEETYNKKIWDLTDRENETVRNIISDYVEKITN